MRIYFSLFLAFLATVSGFYLTWRFTQPELNGHWHILSDEVTWSNPGIATIDIHWSGAVIADEFTREPNGIIGDVDRFRRHIYLGPSCLSLELDLSWRGDTLFFDETPSKGNDYPPDQFAAIRIPAGECTFESDFFLKLGRKFWLPQITGSKLSVPYDPQSLSLFVTPDIDKPLLQGYYGREIDWNELADKIDKLDVKMPTTKRPVSVSIFADDGFPTEQLEYILDFFRIECKERTIYRVYRKLDFDGHYSFYSVEL